MQRKKGNRVGTSFGRGVSEANRGKSRVVGKIMVKIFEKPLRNTHIWIVQIESSHMG